MTASPNGDSPTDKFIWTSDSGVTITLPSLRRVKSGTLRKLRGKTSELDLIYGVLEDVCDDATLEQTDALDLVELGELFSAWQGSGASLGEASRSSN